MIRCTFHLNGGRLSILSCPGIGFFPAYSGNAGNTRNNPEAIAMKDVGPLPPGKYYIVNRGVGGFATSARDWFLSSYTGSDRSIWFALYRNDDKIDDQTFIDDVHRGQFRLHPAGYSETSNGCITLQNISDFRSLREALLNTATFKLSASLNAYGTIQVY
ncbi:DUF2778 domain-containing protein [Pseudomonas panipatensis]|uniref:DUF2778 domain-containing protein n=1 Tax=Pseudomonas panipatensis TaxID=428992 RepID=UPI0035AE8882